MLVLLCLAAVFAISTSVAETCDDDPCSARTNTELTKIRDDLRDLKSVVEGLQQKVVEIEESKACPGGFTYLPEARGCYKVIEELQTWSTANETCQSLNPNANLISIESKKESEGVTKYLTKLFESPEARKRCTRPTAYPVFWTSGQRVSDCRSKFVWKTTTKGDVPFGYQQWTSGEPNCVSRDRCVELIVDKRYDWNDNDCNFSSCSVCEYDLN